MFGYYPAATHSSAGERRKTIHFPFHPSIRPPVNFFFFFLVSTFSIRVIRPLLVIDIAGAKEKNSSCLMA
jgi:hypothetical protein